MNNLERARLTERENRALRKIAEAMPNISEYRKGYFAGYGEAMVDRRKAKNKTFKEMAIEAEEKGLDVAPAEDTVEDRSDMDWEHIPFCD